MGRREDTKTKLVFKLIPIVIHATYGVDVPTFGLIYGGVREHIPLEGIQILATKARTQMLEVKWMLMRVITW
jgi:hypothetical protein